MQIDFRSRPLPIETPVDVHTIVNTVEFEIVTSSSYDVIFTQEFEGGEVSFTRDLFWYSPLDRAIMRLEAKRLGVSVRREGDLHRLARTFHGRYLMQRSLDQEGNSLVVMRDIAAELKSIPPKVWEQQPLKLSSRSSVRSSQ